ncbi:unnamed protein product [Didymodactylos carnosus]|uniref:Uncharacterized protein n=1 Tax=Didymodactylos carnosus TaxID=1234261 RepID=A0A815Z898_9BILA|nr:unnamed protein product [Didymodactylos carnosus]CAF4445922.1 unnamed protein product [Didymodactylos carnosus]
MEEYDDGSDVDDEGERYIRTEFRPPRCPFNCAKFDERRCPPILKSLLSKLTVQCVNKPNGCEQVLFYEQLEHHEQVCEFCLIKCQNCGREMLKKMFDEEYHKCVCDEMEKILEKIALEYDKLNGINLKRKRDDSDAN